MERSGGLTNWTQYFSWYFFIQAILLKRFTHLFSRMNNGLPCPVTGTLIWSKTVCTLRFPLITGLICNTIRLNKTKPSRFQKVWILTYFDHITLHQQVMHGAALIHWHARNKIQVYSQARAARWSTVYLPLTSITSHFSDTCTTQAS